MTPRSDPKISKFKDKIDETHQWELTHPQLAILPDDIFSNLIKIFTNHPLGYAALRPLLLIESLPGLERWKASLLIEPQNADWQTLSMAVANTLNHQSQEATDVRWLTILFKLALGQIKVAEELSEKIYQIIHYPNKGDMRSVRPSIRSMEMAFRSFNKNETWSQTFWAECLKKTDCIPSKIINPPPIEDREAIIQKLHHTQYQLLNHWFETLSTSDVDARHDTVFGFGFYSLGLLLELLIGRNRQGLLGRLTLKTLTDCRISLAYLISKDSPELWLKFRNFGAGQAKLALLKMEEIESEKPSFINEDILEQIANEYTYQEFLNIELGHWCGLDLRKMAENSGTKADYDKYYGWTSTYSHAQWPAMRDACFTTCFNPLHRLHRAPRLTHRFMEDTVPDSIKLINKILEDISKIYLGSIEKM